LLRLLLHPANFLLLDEPTNHLDLRAKDVLLGALMEYTGTVVFVSHDRYFIDNLATRVFEIGDGKVEIFPGNYEDYLWRKQGGDKTAPTLDDVPRASVPRNRKTSAQSATKPATIAPTNGNSPAEPAKLSEESKGKRVNPIKRKQVEDRVHELEDGISRAEAAITACETALQNFVSAEESQRQSQALDHHKANHAALIEEWEGLSRALQESD
jgi:ATP-binding cassette subfamily F protein 3